jgi:hypothetical protein
LNPNPLSPRFGLLSSRLTPREAKGVDPIKLCESLFKFEELIELLIKKTQPNDMQQM